MAGKAEEGEGAALVSGSKSAGINIKHKQTHTGRCMYVCVCVSASGAISFKFCVVYFEHFKLKIEQAKDVEKASSKSKT